MIKAETFRYLENTLTGKLMKEVRDTTKPLYAKIMEAMSDGNYVLAKEMVGRLSLADIYFKMEPTLIYHTHLAMLFGASRVTEHPGTSVVGLGFEKMVVQQIVQGFMGVFGIGQMYLQEKLLQLIADIEEGEKQTQKAEKKKPRILKEFQSHMDEEGKSFFNVVSSLHTSRVSAYGFTAEANVLGVKEYQISEQLDSRTCPVCRKMHGKKFPVREARSFLSIVARMTDAEGLKFMQPWPKHDKEALNALDGMGTEELVSKHWHVPPFHPRCRGMLTAVGKVLPLDAEMPEDEKPIVDKVEFDILGLKVNDDQVKLWKDNLNGVTPSVLLAMASDKTPDVLLAHSVKEGKVHSLIDLLSMSISSKFMKFVLKDVQYTFGLEEKQMLLEGSSKFTKDVMSRVALHYLRKMYAVGKEAGMKSLKMVVTKDPYLWAKRGFYPSSLEEWEKAKDLIKGRYMSSGISQEVKDAIEVILKSDNPADMGKLVDLDIPKDLLKDLVWNGTLQFDDAASMEKFLTYLSE